MISKVRNAFTAVVSTSFLFFSLYHHFLRRQPLITAVQFTQRPNALIQEPQQYRRRRHVTTAVSVLLPDWEVLLIAPPWIPLLAGNLTCLFPNNHSSPAKLAGTLPSPPRSAFKCELPPRLRRNPLPQPALSASPENLTPAGTEMLRWNYLTYGSLSTRNDVILFAKGINRRGGINRPPNELRCVVNGVRTAVITAVQEVFRCSRPNLTSTTVTGFGGKITLEIKSPQHNLTVIVPSVAHYAPPRTLARANPKLLMCACTMVYNAIKFLKEWVMYHSAIGVEKFILYDNGSDDDLSEVVNELIEKGFDVSVFFWVWPKTQEAGFSHCAVMHNDMCTWMMYVDVDEFVYSPKWVNSSLPSRGMLGSMLKGMTDGIGQVMIECYEFGPSGQRDHPLRGVTQGYNCRTRGMNRHKSIVLLDAVDESLLNVVHHFKLKQGYRSVTMRVEDGVVNHYKYQAWPEFKTKYRRRVSAYVVDWMQASNLASKDRAPGLGLVPVEPDDWPQRFCQVYDNRLKDLTHTWFGYHSPEGNYMAWQR